MPKPDPASKKGAIDVLRKLLGDAKTSPREKINAVRALGELRGFSDEIDWTRQSEKARLAAVREVVAEVLYQVAGIEVEYDDEGEGVTAGAA